jgi:hypothetical protein
MLADQLIRRNLDLAAALAAQIDYLAPAEIIEGRIRPIDEGAGHLFVIPLRSERRVRRIRWLFYEAPFRQAQSRDDLARNRRR